MIGPRRTFFLAALALPLLAGTARAQDVERVRPSLLREVMPTADRFDPAEGNPPVKRAYRGDELVGYVFVTSDLPPEERGYSGPVRAVVGMTPDGTLTGVRVTEYHESYMSTKGDFLRRPGFQEQYAGKYIGESFRVYEDVDGISKVSVSVRALSRGVRNTARRVAGAYPPERPRTSRPVGDVLSMSWFVMRQQGITARMDVTRGEGEDPVGVTLVHLESEELGRYLIGGLYQYVLNAVERRGGADELILYAVDGGGSRLAIQQGWSVAQGGVTTSIPVDDVIMLGAPWDGLLSGEVSIVGAILLDDDVVDIEAPLEFSFARGDDLTASVEYTSQRAREVMAAAAAAAPPAEPDRDEAAAAPSTSDPTEPPDATAAPSAAPSSAELSAPSAQPAEVPVEQIVQFDYTLVQEETTLERLLTGASWARVGWIALVLVLATIAFVTKTPALRWVSLATTLAVLGFVDGGFLSVSHLTNLVWVGPSAILSDLPLLMMVVFTLVTLLLVGSVFCRFRGPFGALQDFLDRLVPAWLKRELPWGAHRAALKAKYVILAIVFLPALAGSETSIYQYFEPFGTVFFLSTNGVLWTIAGSILIASAVVPRFYCRYACPLGASLAIGSLLTWRRIPRVEQCSHCVVCERKCPTGAIEGPAIDFKECVRCNVCEVQLIQRAGVCRHDMEEIRPRLVQLQVRAAERAAGPVA